MRNILIVGCGDIGRRVARLCADKKNRVIGIVRSTPSLRKLREDGIEGVQADLDFVMPSEALPTKDAIIHYYAPPPREGQGDPRLDRFLASIHANAMPKRIIYISTSGVYGHCNGEWITEEREPKPDTDRGRRRLAAEQHLKAWCAEHGVEYVILRVPGIYGPGRLPIKRLKSASPIVDERECSYSNRVHADDLANVCATAATKAPANSIYNVSDGQPTTMTDYFLQVADLLAIDPPPVISLDEARATLSEALLSFLDESKRLDNSKMLKELGISLIYPSLKEGLPACIEDQD